MEVSCSLCDLVESCGLYTQCLHTKVTIMLYNLCVLNWYQRLGYHSINSLLLLYSADTILIEVGCWLQCQSEHYYSTLSGPSANAIHQRCYAQGCWCARV